MTNPKFAFFGTPKGAVYVLESLKGLDVLPSIIVTLPDAPVGRKKEIIESDVAKWAHENNIECHKPEKLSDFNLPIDLDFSLVAAYGKIIPESILFAPRGGTFNIHPSKLPRFRGPTPIQSAILGKEKTTAVTIIKLDKEEDHGPIVAQSEDIEIGNKNYLDLEQELFKLGAEMFYDLIDSIIWQDYHFADQDHASATFTKKYSSEDAYIDSNVFLKATSSDEIDKAEKMVRALNPEPGTWTIFKTTNGEARTKILSAQIENGKLTPIKVIPAGKKEMAWEDFLRGNRI